MTFSGIDSQTTCTCIIAWYKCSYGGNITNFSYTGRTLVWYLWRRKFNLWSPYYVFKHVCKLMITIYQIESINFSYICMKFIYRHLRKKSAYHITENKNFTWCSERNLISFWLYITSFDTRTHMVHQLMQMCLNHISCYVCMHILLCIAYLL